MNYLDIPFHSYLQIKDIIRRELHAIHEYTTLVNSECKLLDSMESEGIEASRDDKLNIFEIRAQMTVIDAFTEAMVNIDAILDANVYSQYPERYRKLLETREENQRHIEGEE